MWVRPYYAKRGGVPCCLQIEVCANRNLESACVAIVLYLARIYLANQNRVRSNIQCTPVWCGFGPAHMQLQLIVIFIELFMGSWQCWQCLRAAWLGVVETTHTTRSARVWLHCPRTSVTLSRNPRVLDYFHFLACNAKPAPKVDRCMARIPPERETRARCWCCYCCCR